MFISKIEPAMAVAVTEATVFTVRAPAATERYVVLENLDAANTMTWRFQWSDDGTTWTDVAADTTLAPGVRVSSTLSGHIQYRLRASGNLSIAVNINAAVDIVADSFDFCCS